MANKNIRTLSSRKELDDNLFENISELSHKNASKEEFQKLANRFMIDDSVVFGTSSFYDFTREENRTKKIHVCSGTACMVAKSQNNLTSSLEKHFNPEQIGHAACLGRCHSNSAFMFENNTYSANTKEEIDQILSASVSPKIQVNDYNVGCNTTPILTAKIEDVAKFYSLAEKHTVSPQQVIEELKLSNLRGRGGAGFPFWFKLDAVLKEGTDKFNESQKYIVCNDDEGDPGAYSDMYLMEHQTHKVLFGMYMSGLTVGANTGVLYIRGEYPDSIKIVNFSIASV